MKSVLKPFKDVLLCILNCIKIYKLIPSPIIQRAATSHFISSRSHGDKKLRAVQTIS